MESQKLKLLNNIPLWSAKRRYKVGQLVSHLGIIYQNKTGINSEPPNELNWKSLTVSADIPTLQAVTNAGPSTDIPVFLNNGASIANVGPTNNASASVVYGGFFVGSSDNATGNFGSIFDVTADRVLTETYDDAQTSSISVLPGNIQMVSDNGSNSTIIDILPNEVTINTTGFNGKGITGILDFSSNYVPFSFVQKVYVDSLISNNVATNATTVVLSAATLDSTYPTATTGFKVHALSIVGGGMIYEKTSTGWCQYASIETV